MKHRSEALKSIAGARFDLCIIGGGATGAGCALDAQLRGLKTVLVDAADFASATSSASTKLVHGGVRYLQQAVAGFDIGQLRLVRHALRERRTMLDNAPYLAHPLEHLVPCFSRLEAAYYLVGMKLYDWIAGRGSLFPSRYLSLKESLRRMPMLRRDGVVGTVAYADGQFDDARYNLALLQSFTDSGGEAINHARVIAFEKSGGKLSVGVVEDQLSRDRFSVQSRAFLNATGPFADSIRQLASGGTPGRIRPSKGSHILLPLESPSIFDAILVPKTEDGRVIFAIPWLGRLLVGTTEDDVDPGEEMAVTAHEADFLLRHLNPYLERAFNRDDIVSGFAGMRPLVSSREAFATKKLIRDYEVELDRESGLISVLGGKWTAYRAMAESGIDAVMHYLGLPAFKATTADHQLSGSDGWSTRYWEELVAKYYIADETAQHLSNKYGSNASKVLDLAKQDAQLLAPIVEGLAPIRAEVVYSVRYEMAMTLADFLARRIGLELFSWRESIHAAPVVGPLVAAELGWSMMQTQEAIAQYASNINRMLQTAGLTPERVDLRHAG